MVSSFRQGLFFLPLVIYVLCLLMCFMSSMLILDRGINSKPDRDRLQRLWPELQLSGLFELFHSPTRLLVRKNLFISTPSVLEFCFVAGFASVLYSNINYAILPSFDVSLPVVIIHLKHLATHLI